MRLLILAAKRIFILTVVIFTFTGCGRQSVIVNSVTEREANEIVVFLSDCDIGTEKVPDLSGSSKAVLWNISVSSGERLSAMSYLSGVGLPRKKGQTLLDLFSSGGLVSSESEELIRYRAGLAAELENTIQQIDGIIEAYIQLSFPEKAAFGTENDVGVVTASVFVKHLGILDDPNAHLVTKIKRLIASSINGLSFENVTVISDKARIYGSKISNGDGVITAEKDYVKIWSVIVEKGSSFRFRMIFLIFSSAIVALTAILAWVIWKIFPILHQHGGLQVLLSGVKEAEDAKKNKKDPAKNKRRELEKPLKEENDEEDEGEGDDDDDDEDEGEDEGEDDEEDEDLEDDDEKVEEDEEEDD